MNQYQPVSFKVRMDPDLKDYITQLARAEGKSLNHWVIIALERRARRLGPWEDKRVIGDIVSPTEGELQTSSG